MENKPYDDYMFLTRVVSKFIKPSTEDENEPVEVSELMKIIDECGSTREVLSLDEFKRCLMTMYILYEDNDKVYIYGQTYKGRVPVMSYKQLESRLGYVEHLFSINKETLREMEKVLAETKEELRRCRGELLVSLSSQGAHPFGYV